MPKRPAASRKEGAARKDGRTTALARVSLNVLLTRTRKQLEEAARQLALSGVGRLKKSDLARRVHEALHKAASAAPPARSARPRKAPAAEPAATEAPAAARTRRVAARGSQTPTRRTRKREEPGPETGARSKFVLGGRASQPQAAEHIPWGYGRDRVSVLPIDPRRLYAYWEVRDESIEGARQALGRGGPDAWLNLRVYDITGRIFDGTNAHSYFDVKVDRDTRQWFLDVGKPASTHCVEVGLRSHEGYFVKIARSGRVDLPRAEPWGPGPVEWLSVRETTGEIGVPVRDHARAAAPSQAAPAAHGASTAPPAPTEWAEGEYRVVSDMAGFREWAQWSAWESHDFLRTEWLGGQGRLDWFAAVQRFEWVGPVAKTSWEAGPFPLSVEVPGLVEERHEGPVLVQEAGGWTRVVYGPWQVVIRGIGAHAERRVIARWEVRKSWVSDAGLEVEGRAMRWRVLSPEEGAARRPGASLALLAGASELFRVGASEIRYIGASETLFAAASETRYRGASERRLRGASEQLVRGASEWLARGASERVFVGASERLAGGASEKLGRGGSEDRLGGASERSPYPAKPGRAGAS